MIYHCGGDNDIKLGFAFWRIFFKEEKTGPGPINHILSPDDSSVLPAQAQLGLVLGASDDTMNEVVIVGG